MAAESLRRKSLAGLESLADTDEQAYADAQFARMEGDLTRDYDQRTQATRENAFGRGLGLSTYLNDELAKQATSKSDALIRARREADLAARSATLAALGQAAGAAQADLSRQQNAVNADATRQQNARALDRQESTANRGMLVGGLGSLGAAGLYGAARGGAFKGLGGAAAGAARRLFGNGPAAGNVRAGLDPGDIGGVPTGGASPSDFSVGGGWFDAGDIGGVESTSDFSGGGGGFDFGDIGGLDSLSDVGGGGGGFDFGGAGAGLEMLDFLDPAWFKAADWSDVMF